jgi:hypothetical protein
LKLLHRQQYYASSGSISFDFDILSLFPRLVLLTIIKDIQKPHKLQLTLYRPIGLATLLKLSNERTSAARNDIVNLFGRHFFLSKSASIAPRLAELKLKGITDLIIKPGAYLSWPTDIGDMPPWRPIQGVQWSTSKVCIEDEGNLTGIKETLAIMFGHSGGCEPIDMAHQEARPWISLTCSSSVFGLVTEAVSRYS